METDSFVQRFFGEDNRFSYADVQQARTSTHEAIQRWTSAHLKDREPVVLPHWSETGVTWYGIAQTERQARRLAEEVHAFIGPSYSSFTGGRAELRADNAVERLVETYTGGHALKFVGEDEQIREALQLMHDVREEYEPVERGADWGIGRSLRRFDMALQAGDRKAAEAALGYIRERELLDRANCLYLRVRLLAAFRRWDELLDAEAIFDLIQDDSRPLRVTEALIQAVYHRELLPFEDANDPEGAVAHFRDSVLPEYGGLLSVRSSMDTPEVMKAFLLQIVVDESPSDLQLADLLEAAERVGLTDPFFDALANLAGDDTPDPTPIEDPLRQAADSWARGDYDAAFHLLRTVEPSVQKVNLLVPLYWDLESLEVGEELKQTLLGLPESDRSSLVDRYPVCGDVVGLGGSPSGWAEWFQAVSNNQYETQEKAMEFAERLEGEWHAQVVLDTSGALAALVEAVEEAPVDGVSGRTISLALPKFLSSLQKDPEYPRSTLQGLYKAVHTRIPYADDLTRSDLDVYRDLAEMRLEYGVSTKEYKEIVEYARYIWSDLESRLHVDWLLEFAELLVLAPTRDEEARLQFLTTVAQAIRRFSDHVEPIQIELFGDLCKEVNQDEVASGLEDLLPQSEDRDDRDVLGQLLNGSTLGIYTLTESAGRRVERFLQERCPDVTVHLRHDKAGSDELHRIARNCDYFLVVTRSASHAATGVIEHHVPTDRLIRPDGKGQSSMLRALQAYAWGAS
jgi:hypothetical protein